MNRFFNSLIFKIGVIIILAEIMVLSVVGYFYITRFSEAIDRRIEEQVTLPSMLMNKGLLSLASLAEEDTMKQLVGETLIEGWAVDEGGNIFASFSPEYRGVNIADIPDVTMGAFDFAHPQARVESTQKYVTSITPIYRSGEDRPRLFVYIKVGTDAAEQEKNEIRNAFVMGTIVTAVLTSLIIILSFRFTISNRISHVLGILKQVEAGDLSVHASGKRSKDELGVLQSHVNSMMETLRRRNQEREQAEEERLVHEKLRLAYEKEQELNELKSNLLSVISHEMRTPVTIISTAASLIEEYNAQLSDAERTAEFHKMQTQIEHLSNILDDVSLAVKAQTGNVLNQPVLLDLNAFCSGLVDELQPMLGARVTLKYKRKGDLDLVQADPKLMWHILRNLLSNAITYSPDGGNIEFKVSTNAKQVKYVIRDEGIGIAAEDQAHLFEAYFRGSNVNHIGGTGLGLKIVKDFVELCKGQIEVESEIGKGSQFTVVLPIHVN
jgi:signal transduction histidine kinase